MKSWKVRLLAFFSLALLFGAAWWIYLTVVGLDDAQARLRQKDRVDTLAQLALWRMDVAIVPLIVQEAARPYFHYYSMYPSDHPYSDVSIEDDGPETLEASPLLSSFVQYTIMHFQVDPDATITSPHVPDHARRKLALDRFGARETIVEGLRRLELLRAVFARQSLLRVITEEESALTDESGLAVNPASSLLENIMEFRTRKRHLENARKAARRNLVQVNGGDDPGDSRSPVEEGMIRPYWCGGALFLARHMVINGEPKVQGCWLDWPAIRKRFLADIRHILPNADIVPALPGQSDQSGHLLASLPLRLIPGAVARPPRVGLSPVRFSLYLALGSVVVAAIAVAVLLRGAIMLSERRGAFVSAVTHELRTPLTTLNMYTELLAEGRIKTEEKKQRYLQTMRKEATRLGRLVENVLAYSRLDGARQTVERVEELSVQDLLARVRDRLGDRTALAGLTIEEQISTEVAACTVRADVSAVEQIVFNLVDNACKYAARADDQRIVLSGSRDGRSVVLHVRDFGPGISPPQARRLFRPFSKSDSEAASSQPGVGLGLALCRRLARGMGGDLRHDPSWTDGAGFDLKLPIV